MKSLHLKPWVTLLLFSLAFSSCSNNDDGPPPVTENPTANFTFNFTVANAGESVTFTDTSVPGTGTITSWNWTFTGATPSVSTEQNPAITFNSKGEFTATSSPTTIQFNWLSANNSNVGMYVDVSRCM